MNTKLLNITLWGMSLMSVMCLSACSSEEKQETTAQAEQEQLPVIQVSTVHVQSVDQLGLYTATVEAFKTNNISPSTPNRIKRILVDVGSRVGKGQSIAVMDDANIDQVKVQIENVEREYSRAAKLLEIGSGTQQNVDQLKSQLDGLRRQHQNLQENTVLVSPISGVVTARNYDAGDMTGGTPIVTIEQVQPVKIIVNVSESEFTQVRKGMPVNIELDVYPGETFAGQVHLIHPTVDPQTRTFTVEITINNADNRVVPGMFARATMKFNAENHVVVPDRAIVKQTGSGNKYVYIYNPQTQTVDFKQVELGQRLDDAFEVISGVEDGAIVAVSGQTRLADGAKVQLLDNAGAAAAKADTTQQK